jgi:hypothetical protein
MARRGESHHLIPPNTAIPGNNPLENELSVMKIEEAPRGLGLLQKCSTSLADETGGGGDGPDSRLITFI